MGAESTGIIFDDLEWPLMRVSRSREVEYFGDGARVFNCTKHSTRGSTKNVQKIGVRRWNFFAKSAGRCFTPVIEIKPNSVSLRRNFYADIQLIRGRFWLQLWMLEKFSEPRVSWKYLAKMWNNSEMPSPFATTLHRWAPLIRLGGRRSVARVYL